MALCTQLARAAAQREEELQAANQQLAKDNHTWVTRVMPCANRSLVKCYAYITHPNMKTWVTCRLCTATALPRCGCDTGLVMARTPPGP